MSKNKIIWTIIIVSMISAVFSCILHIGLFNLMVCMMENVKIEMGILWGILVYSGVYITPVTNIIVSIQLQRKCKQKKCLTKFQGKVMMLLSNFFYVLIFGTTGFFMTRHMGFGEGLIFIGNMAITAAVVVIWTIILVVLLIVGWKRRNEE